MSLISASQHDADLEAKGLFDGLFENGLGFVGRGPVGKAHIAAGQDGLDGLKPCRFEAGFEFGHLHLALAQIDAA
jgi:hypothetical protein